ncbi:hypothetical protein R1flu_012720 [Riccia fluitans]|uniref:Uncharacterized protein n=1 Tax=Riccia fluitans TaxID=41844 RepID=A0ABD1ZBE2_9MARC
MDQECGMGLEATVLNLTLRVYDSQSSEGMSDTARFRENSRITESEAEGFSLLPCQGSEAPVLSAGNTMKKQNVVGKKN